MKLAVTYFAAVCVFLILAAIVGVFLLTCSKMGG